MRKRYKCLIALAVAASGIYLFNASWLAGPVGHDLSVLAHRGMAQAYFRDALTNETCTASRMLPSEHDYLENTLEGFEAGVRAGADMIEFDIHPTTDGDFVVFHDWTLDCRTDGTGRTRDHSLEDLKALDIGYGYTSDGGRTYPFRGQFVGVAPSLSEVLVQFPETSFLINIKSRSKDEAVALLSYIPEKAWPRLVLVGHPDPLSVIVQAKPETVVLSRRATKDCLRGYVLMGWFGRVPESCHNTYVAVPKNYRLLIWGWPYRFEARLDAVGSRAMLLGDYDGMGSTGIDTIEDLAAVPEQFSGIVMTDKVELVGPYLNPSSQ